MSINLTQAEANALIAMEKRPADTNARSFPALGGKLVISLESMDRTEDFLLDVTRSRIDLSRITYQNRGRQVVVLLRLDLNGAPHRNPDGENVPCPHLHVYREGFGDKWAQEVDPAEFTRLDDRMSTYSDFLAKCNVIENPILQSGLF